MHEQDKRIAEELKQKLSKIVQIVDFKVFGSRARGDGDEYSDMDVFLEVEYLTKDLKEKISDTTWEVGFENGMVVAALVFTRNEIENTPLRSASIVRNINREGIRI